MSHDSVGIGWLGVLRTALVGCLLGVGTCIGSVDMRHAPVFEFVVSIRVLSVYSVVMEWMEVLCSALSVSVVGFRMQWLSVVDFRMRYLLYPITS